MTFPANVDALLVLQRSDVAHIAAARERFEGVRLVFTDPGMLDDAVQHGLRDFEFRRLDLDRDRQARITTEALTLATAIDLALSAVRRRLFGPGVFDGWDVGVFHLGLQKLALARQIGAWAERAYAGRRLGVLRARQPQQLYFDSFLVADLVAQDPARWVVLDHHDVHRLYDPAACTKVIDGEALRRRVESTSPTVVSHLPTCFYDRAWLADEVGRSHPRSIDLPSPWWDVPVRRADGEPLLRPRDPSARDGAAATGYRAAARDTLAALTGDWLPLRASRDLQLDLWADRCAWQAESHAALRTGLDGTRPQFLVADQDTGLNGPLFSIADALGSDVTVFPHSGQPSMVLPHSRRVTAVQRAGFAAPVRTVLGRGVPSRTVQWGERPARRTPERIRNVCLLLNSLSTDGLSYVDLLGLAGFYKPLAALCASRGVELTVRPKPGSPALSVLAGAFGIDGPVLLQGLATPLPAIVERTDLCIGVGEPTTAVTHFLHAGAYTVHVDEQDWPTDFVICSSLVQSGLTPEWRYGEALVRIARLLDDETHFRGVQAAQAAAFGALVGAAESELFPTPTSRG